MSDTKWHDAPAIPQELRMAAEIERLTAENEKLRRALEAQPGPVNMEDVEWAGKAHLIAALRERDELRRQLAEAEQDARRYQWLRENLGKWRIETYQTPEQSMVELHVIGDSCFYSGESFDRIIDGLTRPAEE